MELEPSVTDPSATEPFVTEPAEPVAAELELCEFDVFKFEPRALARLPPNSRPANQLSGLGEVSACPCALKRKKFGRNEAQNRTQP